MKQLKTALVSNPAFLNQGKPDVVRATRHLIFSGNDTDKITIPLCGTESRTVKRKTAGVTCELCKKIATHLTTLDTYAEALAYIIQFAPKSITPDLEIMKELHGEMPTKKATQHLQAQHKLKLLEAATPADIPKNMIGTTYEVYFWNMVELDLVDLDGEPLTPVWVLEE